MELFSLFSPILVAAALFSYLNHRVMKLPTTIGVMLIALAMSLGLILLHFLGVELQEPAVDFLEKLRFREALLDGMLAFLLFAGALHIDLKDLFGQIRVVATLATLGVVASAVLVGFFLRHLTLALGLEIPFIHCLLFGALISPTDPIAVLGILKSAGAPKSLEIKIAGESLFNDGIGVVVFSVILGLARPGAHAEEAVAVTTVVGLLAQEVIGSLLLGYAAGWLAYRLLKTVDNYQVEVLITLALAMGVYNLAAALHSSGPLAVVIAGLLIGNTGRNYAMSERTREHLDTFWELVDEILNVVLFVLIGLEVLVVELAPIDLAVALGAIPLVLLARFLSVGSAVLALKRFRPFTPHAVRIMTWGGLRGGISVALALSLPAEIAARDLIVTVTYAVVVFSILVQGLTIGRLVRWIPGQ